MTKETFTQILRNLNNISEDCSEITDEMAYDIAESTIQSNPGLAEFIQEYTGATDVVGWLMQEVQWWLCLEKEQFKYLLTTSYQTFKVDTSKMVFQTILQDGLIGMTGLTGCVVTVKLTIIKQKTGIFQTVVKDKYGGTYERTTF